MGKSRRAYPPEFRERMVELFHASRSATELAQEFGPTATSIRNWVAWAKPGGKASRRGGEGGGGGGGESVAGDGREGLEPLRRENRQVRLEREILSKATAWFARETSGIPPRDSDS